MKVSKFSEQQIALILKQVDDGLGLQAVSGKPVYRRKSVTAV